MFVVRSGTKENTTNINNSEYRCRPRYKLRSDRSRFICSHVIRHSLTSKVTATVVQQPNNQSDLNMERMVFSSWN